MSHSLFTFALAFALSAAPALAQEFKAGDIMVEKPWARATPKGAEVGSGYLAIQNKGAAPDRLTGGTADFGTVEIHQMSSANGVSQMRELKDGLNIPANGSVAFSSWAWAKASVAAQTKTREAAIVVVKVRVIIVLR